MGVPVAIGAALIGAGGSILGGLLGKQKRPPNPPDYNWQSTYGPYIWNQLKDQGLKQMRNPQGLPYGIKSAMFSGMQDSISAGYGSALAEGNRQSALSGLSPAGGEADRRRYYAGQQAGEAQARAVSSVNLADYQARLDEEIRGQNLLFSLTNKSPVYSQIVAQNYWNQLQASNEMAGAVGGSIGNIWEYYQNQKLMDQSGGYGGGGGGQAWNVPLNQGYYGGGIPAQPYGNPSASNWYSNPYGGVGMEALK